MDLIQCIYCSASTDPALSAEALQQLLDEFRRSNAANGVTGMLLYHAGSFFQILEGDRQAVEALFAKIAKDRRHARVTKLIVEPIAERSFAAWTMGYSRVSTKDLAEIPGLNDFFLRGTSYLQLGEGRAKTLLGAFKEGRWRLTLT